MRRFIACASVTLRAASSVVALAASLSACVVVPIDPRTGQPYPWPQPDGGRTTVVMPPVAATPPGPSVITARLYPLNDVANQGGLLSAVVVDSHSGRGTITVSYRGDTLQGEATRVDPNYVGFGRVHSEVLGVAPRNTPGQRGIANAFGTKGVNAQCEYVMTAAAQGTGVCLFSDGAKYQLHFGAG
ncbi:MAG: hypothetical protein OEW27_06220 [Aquincola sp.]|nr:hypothetical protein [Aquincola sp.]MDH5329524.1 hypothetical protein [Aquincola sp.]